MQPMASGSRLAATESVQPWQLLQPGYQKNSIITKENEVAVKLRVDMQKTPYKYGSAHKPAL